MSNFPIIPVIQQFSGAVKKSVDSFEFVDSRYVLETGFLVFHVAPLSANRAFLNVLISSREFSDQAVSSSVRTLTAFCMSSSLCELIRVSRSLAEPSGTVG